MKPYLRQFGDLLGNYSWGLPVRASTYAGNIDQSLMILHAVMILVFVLWGIYMTFCLIRYKRRDGTSASYTHETPWTSYIPDVLMLSFEIWLIFFVGVPIWAHIKDQMPDKEKATEVNLVAEQFSWIFQYPGPDGKFGKRDEKFVDANNPLGLDPDDPDSKDDVVAINELHVPVGKPVLIHLMSRDVIHSFFVPEFRIKQDVVPGMNIPLWVQPTVPGRYEIGCAQLCGTGHYRMRGDIFVLPENEFQSWMDARIRERGR